MTSADPGSIPVSRKSVSRIRDQCVQHKTNLKGNSLEDNFISFVNTEMLLQSSRPFERDRLENGTPHLGTCGALSLFISGKGNALL
uniref:Uncharacterized protein n=1 Tax=Timema poppense TaxID=170557 RepID=A0A7R9H1T1_TIMPO|nr:unnamed protein product [Timema poppensis]